MKSLWVATLVLLAGLLSACSTLKPIQSYPVIEDSGYTIPAIPNDSIPLQYRRTEVAYPTNEKPGTIIVDTQEKYLYFVLPEGKAVRYGIGVGRQGFSWAGNATIGMKREWPTWTPPAPMIKRQPELAKYRTGMRPGLNNPLGARALYLYRNGNDTLYRIHGTPEWQTIGKNVSSGCIRLMNHDIIDLYNRAEVGAKVIVK